MLLPEGRQDRRNLTARAHHPTVSRRTDLEMAAGSNQESRPQGNTTVMRQVQGEVRKSIHKTGLRIRFSDSQGVPQQQGRV